MQTSLQWWPVRRWAQLGQTWQWWSTGVSQRSAGPGRTGCEISGVKSGIEGAGPLRQHAGQISIEAEAGCIAASPQAPRCINSLVTPQDFPERRRTIDLNSIRNPDSPKEGQWQARQVRFGQVH